MNHELIVELYTIENKSLREIAKLMNSNINMIRKILLMNNVCMRSKSEAQKLVLDTGKNEHPTKGKKREYSTKVKLSKKMVENWKDEDRLKEQSERSKKQWESMSDQEKTNLQKLAMQGVRKASLEGSKLEKFLSSALQKAGFMVECHKSGIVLGEKLSVDIFLAKEGICIEIDGPSHYEEGVFGRDSLVRYRSADARKNGLLTGHGYVLIRIKNIDAEAYAVQDNILKQLLEQIYKVRESRPDKDNRLILI